MQLRTVTFPNWNACAGALPDGSAESTAAISRVYAAIARKQDKRDQKARVDSTRSGKFERETRKRIVELEKKLVIDRLKGLN